MLWQIPNVQFQVRKLKLSSYWLICWLVGQLGFRVFLGFWWSFLVGLFFVCLGIFLGLLFFCIFLWEMYWCLLYFSGNASHTTGLILCFIVKKSRKYIVVSMSNTFLLLERSFLMHREDLWDTLVTQVTTY